MTQRLTFLSGLVVIAVAASALVPDMGFHTPVGTDDVLPLLATLVGASVLLLRPLPDPGPMVMTLIALALLALCVNVLVPEHLLFRALVRGPARILMYLVFVLGYSSVVEGMNARRALVACGVCAVIEAIFGLGAFIFNYKGPWYVGVYFTREPSQSLAGSGLGRIVGTFNTSNGQGMNFASAYLMIFVPVLFALARTAKGKARWGWYLATGLVAAAMLATYTRMSIVALFGGVVVALALAGHLKMILGAGAVGLFGLLMTPGLAQRFLDKNDRVSLYAAALDAAFESPWVGHGDINYLEFIFDTSNRYHTMFGIAGSTPHNSILYGFFRYGLGGALLTGLILAIPILYFAVKSRTHQGAARIFALAGLASFVSFALQAQTNNLLDVPKVAFYFFALWVVLRIVIKQAARNEMESGA